MPTFRILTVPAATLFWAFMTAGAAFPARAETPPSRLDAVRTFADRVLEHGRDTFREEPTPLFVDGLNVDTLEPVRWVHRGDAWIPSNLASQQNLLRTLVGLSELTGQPRYREAAAATVEHHVEHLQMDCGLFQWGGHRFIDLASGRPRGEGNLPHELKFNLPFYEFLWEVDPDATREYIKALWNAHVLDWGKLDMNRHGSYGRSMGDLWDHEFQHPEPFFEGRALTFINCGSDLIYAGAILYRLTGDEGALRWSKRLAEQYVRARHPETGLGVYQYSKPIRRREPPAEGPLEGRLTWSSYGDRAENQFGAEFGDVAREGWMLRSPDAIYGHNALMQLQLAELLSDEGGEFLTWTVNGLKAWARYGYDAESHTVRPMWADGTDLTGHVVGRTGYYGPEGRVFEARPASALLFWSYALGYRLSGEEDLWETVRAMARGHGLGDMGTSPGQDVDVDLEADTSDPMALFAVLELHRAAEHPDYLALAARLGENIVGRRFHHGFFLPSERHIHANFNAVEPLALLALEALERGEPDAVPRYNGGRGFFHGPHDGRGRTTDHAVLWNARRGE